MRTLLTPLGWIVAGLAAATGFAGVLLGWAEFRYLAGTLGAGLFVAFGFLVGRARFRVEVELRPRRVVAGERAFGRLLVVNTSSRRSSRTRLELPVGGGSVGGGSVGGGPVGGGIAEFAVPALPPRGEHEELFAVPTAKRAVIVAGPAVSVRGDPLGLVRRAARWSEPVELFVHPRTVRLRPSAAGLVRDLEGEVTAAISNNDLAFHALRAYEPGDDRRYVHWRTTARVGRLMVRQFTETRRSELVLAHATDTVGYLSGGEFDEESFELGVSVLASIAAQVLHDGTRLRIASGAGELRTATVATMLDDSTRIEPLATGGALRDVVRVAGRRRPPPSVLVVVAGPATPIADLRAVDARFGGDTRTIGLRVQAGADPRLSTLGGLTLVTVGALADLPQSMRKLS